jgi:hypothetical protein
MAMSVETVLRGAFVDLEALHGMLARIHSLGFELIDVHPLGDAPPIPG